MQRQRIDVVQGEPVRIGNLLVTLVSVDGDEVVLKIEDPDNSTWIDPVDVLDCNSPQNELVAV